MYVQMRFDEQALKLAILQSQFAQAFGLSGIHAAVLGAPFIKAGINEAVFTPDSLIGKPASACLKNPMICSSLYLLGLMSIILKNDGLLGKMTGTVYGEQVLITVSIGGHHD